MEKFRNKYRIASNRASWWDYGRDGSYFITICTHNRNSFFGNIHHGYMYLTAAGRVAASIWFLIPDLFPFSSLGAFVVMPNHIHGIINLHHVKERGSSSEDSGNSISITHGLSGKNEVENPYDPRKGSFLAGGNLPLNEIIAEDIPKPAGGCTGMNNPMLRENIPRITRWYKGRTTYESRKTNPEFKWQERYHDHIIRNSHEYKIISLYIINNPIHWKQDSFNT